MFFASREVSVKAADFLVYATLIDGVSKEIFGALFDVEKNTATTSVMILGLLRFA